MTPALQLEILDLRHFTASNLRPLLEAEARIWSQRLEWDYRPSANLLLQYLDSRILPGFVAVENGRVSGYAFCVYEDHKAVIGDVFAVMARNEDTPASQVENRLLVSLIEMLQNSPGVDRIESQLLLHPHGGISPTFSVSGFSIYPRLFMRRDLYLNPPAPYSVPPGFELRPWRDGDFQAAARLISTSYQEHLDSRINDQYCSVAGSLRFLQNIVRFPGCGYFDVHASRVLERSGNLVAMVLCSRVREDVAHITQLCVAPQERGHGLGRLMIEACAANLRHESFRAITLTVTGANENAITLYRHAGFVTIHTFDAMLWERAMRA